MLSPSPAPDGGGLGLSAIIGIACGGTALCLGGGAYYRFSKRSDDNKVPYGASTVSFTQDARTPSRGGGTTASFPTYGDTSVATVDYDYSRAFGGAGNHSLSDDGGTLGSRTRQTAAEDVASGLTSGTPSVTQPPGSRGTIFSDNPTFDQV